MDKAGCISFASKKYEVGLNFAGYKVQVIYDLAAISVLTLEYENHPAWQARELVIGTLTGPKPALPERNWMRCSDFQAVQHARSISCVRTLCCKEAKTASASSMTAW